MPDPAEPPQPPRHERHLFRWVFLTMLVLILASTFALFKWGNEENLPGFVKIWRWRGQLFSSQIRYGRDSLETRDARCKLAWTALAQGSYRTAERQWRAVYEWCNRTMPKNNPDADSYSFRIGECLFLQAKRPEAAQLMKRVWRQDEALSQGLLLTGVLARYQLEPNFAAGWNHHDMLRLAWFELELAGEAFKDDEPALREFEDWHLNMTNRIARAISDAPPKPLK